MPNRAVQIKELVAVHRCWGLWGSSQVLSCQDVLVISAMNAELKGKAQVPYATWLPRCWNSTIYGLLYGVQESFTPTNVGIIMPQGLHSTENHIWKSQCLEGVVDPRECWRNRRASEDGWKAVVFSVVWTLLPWLIPSPQCEVIDLSSEKTRAQSKPGEGDGCSWLIKVRLGGCGSWGNFSLQNGGQGLGCMGKAGNS